MRNRDELLARLAKDDTEMVAARHRAAMMWRDHPARQALRARFDAVLESDMTAATSAIASLLADGDPVSALMVDLVATLAREPFFEPPCPTIGDDVHRGIAILDHPAALLSLSVASADTIAARKAAGGGAGSIGISGAVSVIRFHRAGGAMLRFWDADGASCRPSRQLHSCRDGDVLVIDGRSRGYVIEACRSDIVMLRATLRSGQSALRREYDAESRMLVGVASNDEGASRSQMLLTLLRIEGRRDAAHCFVDALEAEPHFLRWHAMREYLALDPVAALPHLLRLAASDPHDEVRLAARATLGAIEARQRDRRPTTRCHV